MRLFLLSLVLLFLPAAVQAQGATAPSSSSTPLRFHLGGWDITPGGFVDFTAYNRSTAVGSGIGTDFAAIPANNSAAGALSEFGESAQNSRLSLQVSSSSAPIYGYVEADFLGAAPGNVAVSSNSASLRLRVAFVDLRRGAWELVAGQDWSLLTPSKQGLSPRPPDVAYGDTMDTNYQVGLTWARQPQLRVLFHASPHFTLGLSLENTQPYIGGSAGAAVVTLPGGASGPYAAQLNSGNTAFAAPGFTPDVIAKLAYDSDPSGGGIHLELAGLESEFRLRDPVTAVTQHAAGTGVEGDAAWKPFRPLRLFANSFVGDGGGRYFFGLAPDLIVRQDGTPAPLLTRGGMTGAEYQIDRADLFYTYYGGLVVTPNFDLSGATPVGYGYLGSPAGQNRTVQEATLGLNRTLWASPRSGSLQLLTQFSYVARAPFRAAAGAPPSAHALLAYADLRFNLP